MRSSRRSRRRCPGLDPEELRVFLTPSVFETSAFHNAASVFLNTAVSFGEELEFLAGRCLPLSVSDNQRCLSLHSTLPWRQDCCQGSLLLPPPLPL